MEVNPRGRWGRRDGTGKGVGQPDGLRRNQNPNPCVDGVSGLGKGKGRVRKD